MALGMSHCKVKVWEVLQGILECQESYEILRAPPQTYVMSLPFVSRQCIRYSVNIVLCVLNVIAGAKLISAWKNFDIFSDFCLNNLLQGTAFMLSI